MAANQTHLTICQLKVEDLVAYLNGLFQFGIGEMTHFWKERKRNILERMNILLAASLGLSTVGLSAGYVFGLHRMNPFGRTSLAGYWLLLGQNVANDYYRPDFLVKMVIFLFKFWVWF